MASIRKLDMVIPKRVVMIAIPIVIAILFASYKVYQILQQQQLDQVEVSLNQCIEAHAKLADSMPKVELKVVESNELSQLILGDVNAPVPELDALGNSQSKTMDAALNKALSTAWISQKNSRDECMAKAAK